MIAATSACGSTAQPPAPAARSSAGLEQVPLTIESSGQTHRFTVEVAETGEQQAQGLMFRKELAPDRGMIFPRDPPGDASFWMKNTLIPLDMLFFDGAGRLARIKAEARPHDETPAVGGEAIRYVLEINGGLAAELGIEPGAEIRHPALDQAAAAWAC
jgi:uncharacterized membrane protein (UPF0127 family)